ncbi:MAG: tRNA pseudouridine(38-40) synthase TruA [Anaerosomatales bacterium]|nr:tRNA pseudouridine(38-40) synthase TruA [Anaerosomatales bacterium]
MGGTIALTLAYDGSGFAGFARQPGQRTVQGELERALGTVLRREVEVVGAGRTDAGVHALGQVVSFPAAGDEPDHGVLLRSLNALCGDGIVVTEVRPAEKDFSARHSAVAREYRYRLVPGPVPPLFLADLAWWVKGPLALGPMRDAASYLIGEHDFRSFCVVASAEGRRTFRCVEHIDIAPETALGEHCLVIRIVGNAFLHSMVRIIVGSLVEVGRGRRPAEWMGEALEAGDRAAAGPTAPPHGLVLWHVDYPEECWL